MGENDNWESIGKNWIQHNKKKVWSIIIFLIIWAFIGKTILFIMAILGGGYYVIKLFSVEGKKNRHHKAKKN